MPPFDRRILTVLPQLRCPALLLGFLGIGNGVLAIGQAFAIAALVVSVVQGGDLSAAVTALVLVATARAMTGAAIETVAARAGVRASTALREELLLRSLQGNAGGTPGSESSGTTDPDSDRRTLAVHGASSVEPYVARFLPALISAIVLPVLAILTIAVVDWPSALIVVCTVPLLPVFAALIGRATAEATQQRWQALRALSGHFIDVVRGLPVLVGYGRAERQVGEFRRVGDRHRTATMATLRLAFLSSAALELLATISVAMVAVSVGLRLSAGHVALSTGLIAILLAPEAYWPIRRVGTEFHAAADGAAAVQDALAVLAPSGAIPGEGESDPGIASAAHPVPALRRPDRIRSSRSVPSPGVLAVDLGFRFPRGDQDVLRGIDFHAAIGLTTLTGPSGCGKSTLLELLAGIREPTHGTVLAPPAHLVTQRPFLFPGTIRENLLLADERTDSEIASALRAVGLDGLIAERSGGLETHVGDDGFGLSAGQRARLGLARAILSDAPLVLLDEPTAHLDPVATAVVQTAIAELARSRVVIAATHRSGLSALACQRFPVPLLPRDPIDHAATPLVAARLAGTAS